jgi:hypothetical protein
MGNTYAMVNERKKEWLRQWAKIMLIVEQSVSTKERLAQQSNYSKKMPDGSRVLVTRLIQTVGLILIKKLILYLIVFSPMNVVASKQCIRFIMNNYYVI